VRPIAVLRGDLLTLAAGRGGQGDDQYRLRRTPEDLVGHASKHESLDLMWRAGTDDEQIALGVAR
jgi:hypothetical protein